MSDIIANMEDDVRRHFFSMTVHDQWDILNTILIPRWRVEREVRRRERINLISGGQTAV